MYNNNFSLKIIIVILLALYNIPSICSASPLSANDLAVMQDEIIDLKNHISNAEDLKIQFQSLLENLFLNRNSAILSKDTEGLKEFYDLSKKVGQWAYENETTKIQYFSNWSEKQGAKFDKINSIL